MSGFHTKAERQMLKLVYPKGCEAPHSYVAWFDWAQAQSDHGLKQKKCPCCGLWLFPQDHHGAAVTVDAGEVTK